MATAVAVVAALVGMPAGPAAAAPVPEPRVTGPDGRAGARGHDDPPARPGAGPRPGGLVNLAHLDFLGADVAPPHQPGHSTYRLGTSPRVGVLWTYAEPGPGGSYRRLGGGRYDPETDTYGQGAYNADDISRAAVVYLRHWARHGDAASRGRAYELLRGLTYLQTDSGPDAGRVVLWMQPDGTLNPSAEPREEPDPSDSGPSYWLARTIWALGEGYAAFRAADPRFAGFLRDRLDLALRALERDVLRPRYGTYRVVDGVRVPAWLIVDGADASAEAMLGLAAYVRAGGGPDARRDLAELARGVAAMWALGADPAGATRSWPYGAILPWARSRSLWHGWAAQMPAALARAAQALHDPALLRPAAADTAAFTAHLLAAGGPDNGWLPAPVDRTQIAYGVDARLQSLLAVAEATGSPGQRKLAGVAASWYFGNNAAGVAAYDPATGAVIDGVAGDGTVNRNSGAESTIHGLLSMLALEAAPDVAAEARVAHLRERVSTSVVEAEAGRLTGGARAVRPESAWTGESQWSGGGYAELPAGSGVCVDLPAPRTVPGVPAGKGGAVFPGVPADRAGGRALPAAARDRLVAPVVWRSPGRAARPRWTAGDLPLGVVDHGGAGAQGGSAVPGLLVPVTLPAALPAGGSGPGPLCARGAANGSASPPVRVDAVLAQPLVERLVLTGDGRARALLRGFDTVPRTVPLDLPGTGPARVSVFDGTGRAVRSYVAAGAAVRADVHPGGFTVVER